MKINEYKIVWIYLFCWGYSFIKALGSYYNLRAALVMVCVAMTVSTITLYKELLTNKGDKL